MPCIRSCSASTVSVNDGYFDAAVVVVVGAVVATTAGGKGSDDFVVSALDD